MGNLQENLIMHQDRLSKTIIQFQELVGDNQRETLWKIRDCEDLLKTRISEQKVNDIVDKWTKKMEASIADNETRMLEVVAKSYKEASGKIDTLRMFSENKQADIKAIVETQNGHIKQMLQTDEFAHFKASTQQAHKDLEDELLVVTRAMRETKDKSGQMEKKFEMAYDKLQNTGGLGLGLLGIMKNIDK